MHQRSEFGKFVVSYNDNNYVSKQHWHASSRPRLLENRISTATEA